MCSARYLHTTQDRTLQHSAHTHPQNPSFIQMVLVEYITAILEQHTYTMLWTLWKLVTCNRMLNRMLCVMVTVHMMRALAILLVCSFSSHLMLPTVTMHPLTWHLLLRTLMECGIGQSSTSSWDQFISSSLCGWQWSSFWSPSHTSPSSHPTGCTTSCESVGHEGNMEYQLHYVMSNVEKAHTCFVTMPTL